MQHGPRLLGSSRLSRSSRLLVFFQPAFREQPALRKQPAFGEQPSIREQPAFREQPALLVAKWQRVGWRNVFASCPALSTQSWQGLPKPVDQQHCAKLSTSCAEQRAKLSARSGRCKGGPNVW